MELMEEYEKENMLVLLILTLRHNIFSGLCAAG